MATAYPPNVHVSNHPCLKAKLSQLRSHKTTSRDTKQLVHDISLIVGCEALAAGLTVTQRGTERSVLGYEYPVDVLSPQHISMVPILRSGLGMVDAIQTLLPDPVPIFHLGLYREKSTLQPVEYYNNLPYHSSTSTSANASSSGISQQQHTQDSSFLSGIPHRSGSQSPSRESGALPPDISILVDPIIATGATASAAIDTLRDWGVRRIIVCSVLGSRQGVERASAEWPEGTEFFVGGVDEDTDGHGMIVPGVGDVGDRLFGVLGK